MSTIEYRNLLYETSQEIHWFSDRQRLLFICEGFIPEGSEATILDALSLFKKLEEQKNLGIDHLEILKDVLRGLGKWNLLETVEKFEIKRKGFNNLLEHISRSLDESDDLERLVSICKGKIAQEVEGNIKDVRTLFTELEKKNNLGIRRLDFLKTVIGAGNPDLIRQVEAFEKKTESEEFKQRRKAQAVAVLSSARSVGGTLIGTVTPHCTFRNVAGGIVMVTTCMILRRSTSLEEFVSAFTEAVLPAANTLRAISEGSLCFTIQGENALALEALWKRYLEGTLQRNLQQFLVTDDIKQLGGGDDVTLIVNIDEQEYQNARLDLMIAETQDRKNEKATSPIIAGQRNRRNSDSTVFCLPKGNDESALLSLLKQAVIKQEKIERQESQVDDDEKGNEETFSSDWELDFEEGGLTCDEDNEEEEEVDEMTGRAEGAAIFAYEEEAGACEKFEPVSPSTRKYVTAIERYERELAMTSDSGDSRGEAVACENFAIFFQSFERYAEAKEYYIRALMIRKEIEDETGIAALYEKLGRLGQSTKDYAMAKEYYERAVRIRKQIGDNRGEAIVSEKLGMLCQSVEDYTMAREYYIRTLKISKDIGDKREQTAAYQNLGAVCKAVGDYSMARENYEKALEMTIEIGDKRGEAAVHQKLGTLCESVGNHGMAKENYERALNTRKEIGDKRGEAAAYEKLGTVFQDIGDYNMARENHEGALRISKEIGDKRGEAAAYEKLATLCESVGYYTIARRNYERALGIRKEIGDKRGEAAAYDKLGKVCQSVGDHTMARENYERVLRISKEIGDKQGEAAAYEKLLTV